MSRLLQCQLNVCKVVGKTSDVEFQNDSRGLEKAKLGDPSLEQHSADCES